MKGLKIHTVTGLEFEVYGDVRFDEEINTYYCAGESWPEEIAKPIEEDEACTIPA